MFGKYPGSYMHQIASYKFRKSKDRLNPHNDLKKVLQNLKSKLAVTFSKKLFKLANVPEWGLFLRRLILLRGSEKSWLKMF